MVCLSSSLLRGPSAGSWKPEAGSWQLEAGSWKLLTCACMRRQLSIAVLAAAASLSAAAQSTPPYKDASLPVERRLDDLLSRMTLEEKVAQTLAVWQQKRQLADTNGNFDPGKAAPILQNGIGQVTRVSDGVERGGKRRGPRETAEFVNAIQHWVMDHTRLAI